jgi:hypothetical protein
MPALPKDFLGIEGVQPTGEEEGWEVFEPTPEGEPPQEAPEEATAEPAAEPTPEPSELSPQSVEAYFFLHEGDTVACKSSNVKEIRYDKKTQQLYVTYLNGRKYEYDTISPQQALMFFDVRNDGDRRDPSIPCGFEGHPDASPGHWVWQNLRIRGTVKGHKVPYREVTHQQM